MAKHWSEIPGWFDWSALYHRQVEEAASSAVFVEVGAWLGRSSACLGQLVRRSGKAIDCYAVDHCVGEPGEHFRETVERAGGNTAGLLVRHLQEAGVLDVLTLIVADSARAARLFAPGMVDFVFLDAAHDRASVEADLRAWWPRVRPGGVMAGHDYTPHWPGVREAVNAFFGADPDGWSMRARLAPSCWLAVSPSPPG